MNYPFILARDYKRGRGGKSVLWIVLHTVEAPEKGNTAESVARYFQNPPRVGSAHYVVDANSVIQCVREEDQAAGAPGANRQGIHIEHAGYAKQTAAEWADPYSDAMLSVSARLAADIAKRYGIPPVWLSPMDLKAGKKGFASHANCSQAFGGTHWDPGPNFPHEEYLRRVSAAMGNQPQSEALRLLIDGHDVTATAHPRLSSAGHTMIQAGDFLVSLAGVASAFGWTVKGFTAGVITVETGWNNP